MDVCPFSACSGSALKGPIYCPDESQVQGHDREAAEFLEGILLLHQDHRVRLAAARSLGGLGLGCSSTALISALEDLVPSVRHAAILSLGEIGGDAACDALKKLLVSRSCSVRGMAARSLLRASGVPLAVRENLELLASLLFSGDERVREAILVMGEPANAFLKAKLDDESFCVRQHAALTLALNIRLALSKQEGTECSRKAWDPTLAREIAGLYSFRIIRREGGGMRVENTGFDAISRTLCGKGSLLFSSVRPRNEGMEAALNAGMYEGMNEGIDEGAQTAMKEIIETIDLESLLSEHEAGGWRMMGRTLVASTGRDCLAIKFCLEEGDKVRLQAEAMMQAALQGSGLSSSIPVPLGGLFRIEGLPASVIEHLGIAEPCGICYTAESGYFVYLNDSQLSVKDIERGMKRCSQDLALLAKNGFLHTSLIPLFHHRERASFGGIYCWNRKQAGRLDRWLESCLYPNLRLSGIADLEHIKRYTRLSSHELQTHVGEHLLSMSLILGSYFRRRGWFDEEAMAALLRDCFQSYCCALTQTMTPLDCCTDWQGLSKRMAEEMDGGQRGSDAPGDLGKLNGPFPLPELIRAIHLASLFAVLEVQATEKPQDIE